MFKLINNQTTGTLTTGIQMGNTLSLPGEVPYTRMGNFLMNGNDTLVKTGSYWTNTTTGDTLSIGSGLDDDDY